MRTQKDEGDEIVLKRIADEIVICEEAIKIDTEQLKNGVEIRKITGVD